MEMRLQGDEAHVCKGGAPPTAAPSGARATSICRRRSSQAARSFWVRKKRLRSHAAGWWTKALPRVLDAIAKRNPTVHRPNAMQVQTCVPRAAGSAAAAPSCRGRRSFRAFASSNGHEAHKTSIHRLVDAEGAIIVPGMSRAEGQPPAPGAAAQRLSGAPCARRSVRCPVRQGSAARGPQGGLRVGRSGEHARGTFGNPRSCRGARRRRPARQKGAGRQLGASLGAPWHRPAATAPLRPPLARHSPPARAPGLSAGAALPTGVCGTSGRARPRSAHRPRDGA
jgi:hypothetical protein